MVDGTDEQKAHLHDAERILVVQRSQPDTAETLRQIARNVRVWRLDGTIDADQIDAAADRIDALEAELAKRDGK